MQKIKINVGWSLYLPHHPFGPHALPCQNSQADECSIFNWFHDLDKFLHYCYYYPKPVMYCIINQNCYHTYIRKVIQSKFLTVVTHPLFGSLFLFNNQICFLIGFFGTTPGFRAFKYIPPWLKMDSFLRLHFWRLNQNILLYLGVTLIHSDNLEHFYDGLTF